MNIEVTVPDGRSGDWTVETFEVGGPEMDAFNLRAMIHPGGRMIEAGTYKKLCYKGKIIMSNTPAEIQDHLSFIYKAQGNILINGLGLGMALKAILEKPEVKSVTIIEKSQDVIKLVAPTYNKDPRVTIHWADAYEWKPPVMASYDYVWHDIWDDLCIDNLLQMAKLHRKYGKKTKWQGSWGKELCQEYKRRENHHYDFGF